MGNVAAIGTANSPAAIAAAMRSSAPGVASLPPVARTPSGALDAAIVAIRPGATPSSSAACAVCVPSRSASWAATCGRSRNCAKQPEQ